MPPMPVTVTMRCRSTARAKEANSFSRPMNDVQRVHVRGCVAMLRVAASDPGAGSPARAGATQVRVRYRARRGAAGAPARTRGARRPGGRTDRALSSAAPIGVHGAAPRSRLRGTPRSPRTHDRTRASGRPTSRRDLAAVLRRARPVRATTRHRRRRPRAGLATVRRGPVSDVRASSGRVERSRARPGARLLVFLEVRRAGRRARSRPGRCRAPRRRRARPSRAPPGDDRRRCARSWARSAERRRAPHAGRRPCSTATGVHGSASSTPSRPRDLWPQRDGPVVTDGPGAAEDLEPHSHPTESDAWAWRPGAGRAARSAIRRHRTG